MGNLSKIVLDDETLEVEDTKARTDIGDVNTLRTTAKDSIVKAVNECFQFASDGKALIASALTGMGVKTDPGATFTEMANNIAGIETGIDTSDATATAAQILSGNTAYVKGTKITGTMANKSGTTEYTATAALDSTNKEVEMTVPATGYYTTSNKLKTTYSSFASLIGLTSAKLAKGNTILGITGSNSVVDTSAGTATAAQILSGKVAYVNGAKITGTMSDMGSATANGLVKQFRVAKGNNITAGSFVQWLYELDDSAITTAKYVSDRKTFDALGDAIPEYWPVQMNDTQILLAHHKKATDLFVYFSICTISSSGKITIESTTQSSIYNAANLRMVKVANNVFVVFYTKNSSMTALYATIVTVSGTSVTFSSEQSVYSTGLIYNYDVFAVTSTQIVGFFDQSSSNSSGDYSLTPIYFNVNASAGTVTKIYTYSSTINTRFYSGAGNQNIVQMNDNEFLVFYLNTLSCRKVTFNPNATTSSTYFTVGTEVVLTTNIYGDKNDRKIVQLSNYQFAVIALNNSNYPCVFAFTFGSDYASATVGTPVQLSTSTYDSGVEIIKISSTRAMIITTGWNGNKHGLITISSANVVTVNEYVTPTSGYSCVSRTRALLVNGTVCVFTDGYIYGDSLQTPTITTSLLGTEVKCVELLSSRNKFVAADGDIASTGVAITTATAGNTISILCPNV